MDLNYHLVCTARTNTVFESSPVSVLKSPGVSVLYEHESRSGPNLYYRVRITRSDPHRCNTHNNTHVLTRIQIYTRTGIHSHTHTCTHIRICNYTRTRIHNTILLHTNTYIHTYIHTPKHTHAYTYLNTHYTCIKHTPTNQHTY